MDFGGSGVYPFNTLRYVDIGLEVNCHKYLYSNCSGGTNSRGGTNLLFGIIFAENCMKMEKKLDGGEARVPRIPASANVRL